MHSSRLPIQPLLALLLSLLAAVAVLLIGLGSFGLWEPWELRLGGGDVAAAAPSAGAGAEGWLRSLAISASYAAFGFHEWSGRLPLALAGVATVVLALLLTWRFYSLRAGVYASLILLSTPLFVLNSRQMFGAADGFLVQALVAYAAMQTIFGAFTSAHAARRYRWLGLLLAALWLAVAARGFLLGALPPLAAVVIAALALGMGADIHRTIATAVTSVMALGGSVLVWRDVRADSQHYSPWLGGSAQGLQPPSFDRAFEQIFHGFAPWSALLPVALAAAFVSAQSNDARVRSDAGKQQQLGFVVSLPLWAIFAYAAQVLYTSRYGDTGYMAVVPLAAAVAVGLVAIERRSQGSWVVALSVAMLLLLLVRDYGLFPRSPLHAFAVSDLKLPDAFNPKRYWQVLFGLFACVSVLVFAAGERVERPDWAAPYRLILQQWRRSWPHRVWLLAIAVLAVICVGFGVLTFFPQVLPFQLTVLAQKLARLAALLPLVFVVGVALFQALLWATGTLGQRRAWPLLAIGLAIGLYIAHPFTVAASAHFSSREVYATFNSLAKPQEPLAQYQLSGNAAEHYVAGPVAKLSQQHQAVDYLKQAGRRWMIIPADQFPALEFAYRAASDQHLFVADASSGRLMLVSNRAVPNRSNRNPIAEAVRDSAPAVDRKSDVVFDEHIELIGYDVELPHAGYVGAGEEFKLRWVFRVLRPIPGNYMIFVHIDGHGQRLNGDHEPVEGLYPVRYWRQGDIIVDEQTLTTPVNFRPGPYTIYLGFYSGSHRLPVADTPDDRANVGTLPVR